MADIKNYTIFETGTWNGMEFNEGDIDDIAKNFNELIKVQHVPLKLGHNDDQKVTDGQPALGWVESLKRVGTKLVADFVDVPGVIKEAIAKRLYRAVSIELLLGVKRGDKVFNHVLDAVALLGADQPAVNSLGDLKDYLASRSLEYDECGRHIVFNTKKGKHKSLKTTFKEKGMDEEDVKRLIAAATDPLNSRIDTLIEEKEDFRKKYSESESKSLELELENKRFKAEKDEQDKAQKRAAIKLAREEAGKVLEDAVKAKKLLPAQRDQAVKMFGIDDDKRVVEIDLDELRSYYSLEAGGIRMKDTETAHSNSGNDDDERVEKDVFKETHRRITVQMSKDSKQTYKEASVAVFRADPKLHREYLETSPPEQLGGDA